MSQNKTVIQGLEPDNSHGGASSGASSNNLYSRSSQSSGARGTIVPGMEGQAGASSNNVSQSSQPRKPVQPGKPIVGFLYSVSRTPFGEFWPLQMGPNTIGQSEENTIRLAEGTISGKHAVIVTRQIKSGLIAAITDTQSTNGTMINGEAIGFTPVECHDGDIITIGNNYELALILIDAGKRGLKLAENFIPVEIEPEDDDDDNDVDDNIPPFNGGTTRPGGFDPFRDGPTAWGTSGSSYVPNDGTVGMDGSITGGKPGGTTGM